MFFPGIFLSIAEEADLQNPHVDATFASSIPKQNLEHRHGGETEPE